MSGSGYNLPVKFVAEGLGDIEAAQRRVADGFREQAAAAQAVPQAVSRIAESFGTLEQRAQATRRGLGDLRGALELLGASGVAGALGPVSGQIGNLADLFGTAGGVAARFGGVLTGLGPIGIGLGVALTAAGAAAYALSESAEDAARRVENARFAQEAYSDALRRSDELLRLNADSLKTAAQRRREEAIAATELALAIERENLARAGQQAGRLQDDARAIEAARSRGLAAPELFRRDDVRRQQSVSLAQEYERISARVADLEARSTLLRAVIYDAPAGPEDQRGRVGGGSGRGSDGGLDRISQLVQNNVQADAERRRRAEQQALEEIAREERRILEERRRQNERTTDSITRYLADGFADAFLDGERGFDAFLRNLQRTALVTPIRIGAEIILRPIVTAGVEGVSAAIGGSLGSLGASGASLLPGLGGAAGLSGLLATPIAGGTPQFLGDLGVFGSEAALSGQIGTVGGASLGSLLGAGAAGFGAGVLTNSLLGGNQTNGMIGSGLGTAAGIALSLALGPAAPLGILASGILGGAAGGGIGGLFGGSGEGFQGGDSLIAVGPDGRLRLAGFAGKGVDGAAASAAAQQEIDALNAQLAAQGLSFDTGLQGQRYVTAVGTGQSSNARTLEGALSAANLGGNIVARDARVQAAIAGFAPTDIGGIFGAAQQANAFIAQLDALGKTAEDAADPLAAIRSQFDALRDTAGRLGFGLDEVNAAQERAITRYQNERDRIEREAERQRRNAAAGSLISPVASLADFAAGLRTANDNPLNPLARLSAANAQFDRLAGAARRGDAAALGGLQASAQTLLSLSRDVNGTGTGFAATFDRVASVLEQVGGASADALTASVLQAETRDQTAVLQSELQRLTAEVQKLRTEVQQAGRNPLAARA